MPNVPTPVVVSAWEPKSMDVSVLTIGVGAKKLATPICTANGMTKNDDARMVNTRSDVKIEGKARPTRLMIRTIQVQTVAETSRLST